jgi:hypothetical protein
MTNGDLPHAYWDSKFYIPELTRTTSLVKDTSRGRLQLLVDVTFKKTPSAKEMMMLITVRQRKGL